MPGTVAALDCSPDADVVHGMAYYLLEYESAKAAFESRMAEAGDPEGDCREGEPGVNLDFAISFDGCFRSGGRAHLRYVEVATYCTLGGGGQLKAGDVTLSQPALYIAVVGKGNDIERLDRWGSGGLSRPLGQTPRLECGA